MRNDNQSHQSELSEIEAIRYARAVGTRLRAVRKQKRLSLQAVEASSGEEFKASVLGAYERGERSISVPRLQRLAQIYAVPVDQLLPLDVPSPSGGWPAAAARVEQTARGRKKVTIDLMQLDEAIGPERDLLRHYLGAVQVQRGDFNGRVLTIRADDLRVIASMFGRSTEALVARLDELGLLSATGNGTS
ncbi:MAG: transcriptional regulator [Acidimicrobiales bacterium]